MKWIENKGMLYVSNDVNIAPYLCVKFHQEVKDEMVSQILM